MSEIGFWRSLKLLCRYELKEHWFLVVKLPLILSGVLAGIGLINFFADLTGVYSLKETQALMFNAMDSAVFVTMIVIYYYFAHCLYTDRQNGSLFYWLSMPISQMKIAISKVVFGVFWIPAVSFAIYQCVCLVYVMVILGIQLLSSDKWVMFEFLFYSGGWLSWLIFYCWLVVKMVILCLGLFSWVMLALYLSNRLNKAPFIIMILCPLVTMILIFILFENNTDDSLFDILWGYIFVWVGALDRMVKSYIEYVTFQVPILSSLHNLFKETFVNCLIMLGHVTVGLGLLILAVFERNKGSES